MCLNLKEKLQTSPLFKTFVGVFSIVIFGILSGAFIAEITINGKIEWGSFYKATSFYLLLFCCLLMYFYFRLQFNFEESIEKFKDDEYCKAYMRKQCLPEMAKKTNKLIKKGRDKNQLKDLMSDLNL